MKQIHKCKEMQFLTSFEKNAYEEFRVIIHRASVKIVEASIVNITFSNVTHPEMHINKV